VHPGAVGLILLSAAGHVYWNYQVKRAPEPALYIWWLLIIGALLFAPVAVWLAWPISIPARGWYCVAATGLLYAGYYSFIALSYDREDLSRAYPIARGVAPAATAVWGVLFHHEHPSAAGSVGIAAICAGVFTLAGSGLRGKDRALPLVGILAAVATGLCTSGYSAVDKEGVQQVHPALYIVLTFAAGALTYGALLRRTRGGRLFRKTLRQGGLGLVAAASAALGSYLLVLWVLRTEPVSYVVPLRSISVLLSVGVGARLLGEAGGVSRLVAAALILSGITTIAIGG
jgi:drug/metabolite transporter (DMT)-like permease